jgi:SAM-dependent methyltransferase
MHDYTRHLLHFQNISQRSAREVVPVLLTFIQPRSVVDIGCGTGAWLSVFYEQGVEDVCGVDGDWVDRDMLQIARERFLSSDLSKPLQIARTFDLAISLEVAEHIPPESAEIFVHSLTELSPVILFSAAIPFQGGTNHVNEQWPEYWAQLFQRRGYQVIDCIRPKIWDNTHVAWWYAQNMLLFIKNDRLNDHPSIADTPAGQLALVHPKCYTTKVDASMALSDPGRMSLKKMLADFPLVVKSTLARKIGRLADMRRR